MMSASRNAASAPVELRIFRGAPRLLISPREFLNRDAA